MEELLGRLVDTPSTFGSEEEIAKLLQSELKPHVDEINIDKLGNLIARKGSGSPTIMLAAHMDEIGFMIKSIDKKGFLRFESLGALDLSTLPGTTLAVQGSKKFHTGVICTTPPHLKDGDDKKKGPGDNLAIDIGASSEKAVRDAGIEVGSFGFQKTPLTKMLGTRVSAHGLDNRIGCLALVELARALKKKFTGTLYLVGTVQEEGGCNGVVPAAYGIDPDVMLAVDTYIASDTPVIPSGAAEIALGKGPVFAFKDRLTVALPSIRRWVTETAKQAKIDFQRLVTSKGSNDASPMSGVKLGVVASSIAIPVRNLHTNVEVADTKDIKKTINLLKKLVESAHKYF